MYIPTAEDFSGAWSQWSAWKRIPTTGTQTSREEFDRWLKGVKAQAWAEGFDAGEQDYAGHVTFDEPCIKNPYDPDNL